MSLKDIPFSSWSDVDLVTQSLAIYDPDDPTTSHLFVASISRQGSGGNHGIRTIHADPTRDCCIYLLNSRRSTWTFAERVQLVGDIAWSANLHWRRAACAVYAKKTWDEHFRGSHAGLL